MAPDRAALQNRAKLAKLGPMTMADGSSCAPSSDQNIGALLNLRYEPREVRGQGGFATVYCAYDHRMKTVVALKLMHSRPTPALRRRFDLETMIGARFSHPRLVRIIDRGEHEGRPFAVMPLLHGSPLGDHKGAPWPRICRLMLQYLEGMKALHEASVFAADEHRTRLLHRDIKPANCFVSPDDNLTILDLGLVKPLDQELSDLTAGLIVGTPAYMAPECLRGEPATERSEVYSLGVTFYELLTGNRPYHGDLYALMAAHRASRPPPALRSLLPDIPADLERLVHRALALHPDLRTPTAAFMLDQLRAVILSGHPATRPPPRRWRHWLWALAVAGPVIMALVLTRSGALPAANEENSSAQAHTAASHPRTFAAHTGPVAPPVHETPGDAKLAAPDLARPPSAPDAVHGPGRVITPKVLRRDIDPAMKRVLLRGLPGVQSCHDRHGGNRSMRIAVRIRWDGKGRRHHAFPELPANSRLAGCLLAVLEALEFPTIINDKLAYTFRQSP